MRPIYAPLRGDDSTQRFFTQAKLPLSWPSIPTIVPHRLRRKFRSTRSKIRSRQAPASSISGLNTSFNPADTLKSLRTHQWSHYDAQYIVLAVVGIFSLSVMQVPGPFIKTSLATLLLVSLTLPATRQITLPALPIIAWLIFFYSAKFIPGEYRPPIWVKVLPSLENILYGANLSNILSAHKSTPLDILAWLPYGIGHIACPIMTMIAFFFFGPPGSVPVFAKSFGYMNLTGVFIQLCLPTSPPWYENMYGLAPANYSIHGSPAGLAAIDKLFGVDMYTSTFNFSPVVFGALPSLHSGWATLECLYMSSLFPRLRPLFVAYVFWIWWATMYLSHHYAVDLVAGSILSATIFFIAKSKFLPRTQPGKTWRWDYDYVEKGEVREGYAYGLTDLDEDTFQPANIDSDEWTIGSSSSIHSASRSPSMTGGRSPIEEGSMWDGDTLASHSDNEYTKA